eukprot:GHRQ01035575.1.p1 GENE.GHRQ01035575.1~~GHRQ01035575.1.p1  ORF type:complete len:116 (+),score=21.23 GHRQ01035575.1:158-505(+)
MTQLPLSIQPGPRGRQSETKHTKLSPHHVHSSHDLDDIIEPDYSREGIFDIARGRTGWLVIFCIGLLLAAVVVEQFEDVLEHHVELSFFVPLIMGHGGNTGSQSVTTVIRCGHQA